MNYCISSENQFTPIILSDTIAILRIYFSAFVLAREQHAFSVELDAQRYLQGEAISGHGERGRPISTVGLEPPAQLHEEQA